jgi:cyclic pyranopterin phosphate synthase
LKYNARIIRARMRGCRVNPPAGQNVDYLRLSVTDRCNFRCVYCMPPEGIPFKPHEEILAYEDMEFFVRAAVQLGISKVRITGGEPLVRRGLPGFVGELRSIPEVTDISLTTNGVLLPDYAEELKEEGLDRVNISLDSLDPHRYEAMTRGGYLEDALAGVDAALQYGFTPVKLNVVMMPELREELGGFVALTRDRPLHVRFIEWMEVGGCGPRGMVDSLTKADLMIDLQKLADEGLGQFKPVLSPGGWGPAHYYRFPDHKGTVGFIGSVSDHFCNECNRLRLTADGRLKNCLFSSHEVDVKAAVQARDMDKVLAVIVESLAAKTFDKNVLPGRTVRGMSQVGG